MMPDLLRGQTWLAQVSGEALYTDDVPLPANALHAVLVKSTRPHAKITSVDPSAALQVGSQSTAVCDGTGPHQEPEQLTLHLCPNILLQAMKHLF